MKTTLSALLTLALIGGAATVSAQYANRTGSGVPTTPARVGMLAPEREAVSRCRAHCDSVTVAGPHASAPRQSVAERQARQSRCAQRMAS
jgi:hypothetical protein